MKQNQMLLIASLLAIVVSLIIGFRAISSKTKFDRTVRESLKTSEGYDQRFIDRVNRLEDLLATRAQFGYSGGKDPMTGTKRQVVQQKPPKKVVARRPAAKTSSAPAAAAAEPVEEIDPVKLTAIISDASGKKITAVIMDGERSFSVDPGDRVAGRKITKITNDGLYMESDTTYYFYDIYGNIVKKSKSTGAVSSYKKEEQAPAQLEEGETTSAARGSKSKKKSR
jgi:hypothetical protein